MNENYRRHLKRPEWFRKRKTILKRDGYKCRNCGSEKELTVHHRQYHYDKTGGRHLNAWQYKLKYLITLCRRCHDEGHSKFKILNYKV
ncbi:MAG: HNH endonuclease [Bacteroidetes bacterium]|nr:HNH endonuclease [Bacteroidota bacterium]